MTGAALHRPVSSLSQTAPVAQRALRRRRLTFADRSALTRLVETHRKYVTAMASALSAHGLERDDLEQEGFVGLLTAIQRFDGRTGTPLTSYVRYWIRLRMLMFLMRMAAPMRIHHGYMDWKAVFDIERARPRSALPDPRSSAEEILVAGPDLVSQRQKLYAALSELDERERRVIAARHLQDEPVDVGALAELLGLSERGVRDLETRALAKLFRLFESCGGEAGSRRNGRTIRRFRRIE